MPVQMRKDLVVHHRQACVVAVRPGDVIRRSGQESKQRDIFREVHRAPACANQQAAGGQTCLQPFAEPASSEPAAEQERIAASQVHHVVFIQVGELMFVRLLVDIAVLETIHTEGSKQCLRRREALSTR